MVGRQYRFATLEGKPMQTQKTLKNILIELQAEFLNGTYGPETESVFEQLTLDQVAKLKTAVENMEVN